MGPVGPAAADERPPVTDAAGLAGSRERFLTMSVLADPRIDADDVRRPILASWQRSRALNVAADQIDLSYVRDPDQDSPLMRSAVPVLQSLHEHLAGQPVSIVLTDQTGLVLSRLSADKDLERHLDSVRLAPGFSYAEQFVGTNGIGTALEMGGPAHVFGHEHYAEHLEDLACAGVPIHHPITGRTVGAVDLTCWRRDAGALLLTLAKTTAQQISSAMLSDSGASNVELYQEYLRMCLRVSGVVLAVNTDLAMLNDYARTVLDPADQAALLSRASDGLAGGSTGPVQLRLPSGTLARLQFHPVSSHQRAGAIVHVKLVAPTEEEPSDGVPLRGGSLAPVPLPGLVGAAPLWMRASQQIESVFRSGDWLALQGEPGVGKLALLRAVQLRRQPVGRLGLLDADGAAGDNKWMSRARQTLLEGFDSVVVQHVDRLDGPQLRALTDALHDVGPRSGRPPLWVAVTLRKPTDSGDLARLLRMFPSTVEVPPLRLRLEDLPRLVSFFLSRLGHGGQLTCSPEATQVLLRAPWPGNVEQLYQTMRQVVRHRRTGVIRATDLPPEAQTISRRRLSPLESLERDAIVQSLIDASGSKVEAARSLGVSRATIYRKIREFGIVTPER